MEENMASVYIVSEIGKIKKSNENLIFENKDGETKRIMPDQTDLLVLNNHVSVTGESLTLLARNSIPVYFLQNGSIPNITLDFGNSKNGFLRQKQYLLSSDNHKALNIAKSIVKGKIKNQLVFMNRLNRADTRNDLILPVTKFKVLIKKIDKCKTKDQLRGIEGTASRLYFDLFDCHIIPDWAVFGKRSRQPPQTNVNAVMSYLYSLLAVRVQNALEAYGLDTMCSNLHEMTYGKTSLAYDLMEEFRTPIADTLCCSLFNHGVLKPDDFEERDGGVYMTVEGCQKVIQAFESKMRNEINSDKEEQRFSYLELIFNQANKYKKFIMNEEESYVPFAMR